MKRVRSRILTGFAVLAILAAGSSFSVADDPSSDSDSEVVASFLKHIDSLGQVDLAKRELAKKTVTDLKNEPVDAVTEGLLAVYPDYSPAVESSDNDDVTKAIELLAPLADSEDKFLAADASFYLARTLMNAERFEEALPRLEKITHELSSFTVHQSSSQYFKGVAQAGMLNNAEAIESFMQFLQFNPDAPERLRVSAWRQIQQLQAIQDGQLSDVHHHMDFSRRRLQLIETGEKTQLEQEEIVKMLATLIKEQEKKECNSSCKQDAKSQADQKQAAGEKPEQKPGESKSQKGGSSSNPNGQVVKKSYDDSPTSPWSRLRDRSRDPANNAIKEKLPARYRDIVEKYYEAANGGGEK